MGETAHSKPSEQRELQASLRAMQIDDCELWMQMLAFAEKNTFPPRLLAVEAREAVRRQAIGKSRPQTAGLWANKEDVGAFRLQILFVRRHFSTVAFYPATMPIGMARRRVAKQRQNGHS